MEHADLDAVIDRTSEEAPLDELLARRGVRQLLENEVDFFIVGEALNGREAISQIETIEFI